MTQLVLIEPSSITNVDNSVLNLYPGERILLSLGENGSSFTLILNHDDGVTKWQTVTLNCTNPTIPSLLTHQIKTMYQQNLFLTYLSIGQQIDTTKKPRATHHRNNIHYCTNQYNNNAVKTTYYLRGREQNEMDDHYWSNIEMIGCGDNNVLHNLLPRLVVIGRYTQIYVYEDSIVNIVGNPLPTKLKSRIQQVKATKGTIYSIRLYDNNHHKKNQYNHSSYFIRDSLGCDWDNLIIPNRYLQNKVPNTQQQQVSIERLDEQQHLPIERSDDDNIEDDDNEICDIIMSGTTNEWIVLRRSSYSFSDSINTNLLNLLDEFYYYQNQYQKQRLIDNNHRLISTMKRNNDTIQNDTILSSRNIQLGTRCTIIGSGMSKTFGDGRVVQVYPELWVRIGSSMNLIKVTDASTIYPCHEDDTDDDDDDAYEASSEENQFILVHTGNCKWVTFLWSRLLFPDGWIYRTIGDIVLVDGRGSSAVVTSTERDRVHLELPNGEKLVTRQHYIMPNSSRLSTLMDGTSTKKYNLRAVVAKISVNLIPRQHHIDPYRCYEKIDAIRLNQVYADLQRDKKERDRLYDRLKDKILYEDEFKVLQRCKDIDTMVADLVDAVATWVVDTDGCITYPVRYEHRDNNVNGRLFAIRKKFRRRGITTCPETIQGMFSDLRAPLIGAFCYDIDCENSEVRILCSLANQLQIHHLVKTLYWYRDNRNECLQMICSLHNHAVSISQAKLLPNIILSGGFYRTWLNNMKVKKADLLSPTGRKLRKFMYDLGSEVNILGYHIIRHRQLPWTSIKRRRLEEAGRNGWGIDVALVGRIIQQCENEVLTLVHQNFVDAGWIVRVKMFDGIIVEPYSSVPLRHCIQRAEWLCAKHGWNIKLVEKPLYGRQDLPIASVVHARILVERLSNRELLC